MLPMAPRLRRIAGARLDHALVLLGGALLTMGSLLPWIEGSTRLNGYVSWTGMDDTAEGGMLIAAALVLAAWVRWREMLEREVTPGTRFVPLAVAGGCALLWVIAFRKMLYLSWFDLEVGARPQVGLLVAGLGVVAAAVGGLLAATDPDSVAAARRAAEGEKRRSGAGGVGAASERFRRGGGGRPPRPDEYSVEGRVDRASGDDASGGDRGRG
jgi:hypothetical protein